MQGIFFKQFENSYIPNILDELYQDKIYAPFFDGKKDMTVLDLGGNIGLFSFFAAPYSKQIICVEPSSYHHETIETMLKYNKIDQVKLIKAAISNEDGEAELHHNTNTTMFSLSPIVEDKKFSIEKVRKMTLETLLKENNVEHVDFMKLDIEGEEFNVLAGDSFAKVAPKIDSLVVELHVWGNVNYENAWAALRDNGYEVWQIESEAYILGAKRK